MIPLPQVQETLLMEKEVVAPPALNVVDPPEVEVMTMVGTLVTFMLREKGTMAGM